MICKNCGEEMPEVGAFCPFCAAPKEDAAEEAVVPETAEEMTGEAETAEETAEVVSEETAGEDEAVKAPKIKPWHIALIVCGGVLLVGLLAGVILYSLGLLNFAKNDLYCKDSYTVTAEEFARKDDKVVATIGDKKLTNGELMLYYQNDVYTFLNQYYYYLSYFGLDLTLPMDEQYFPMGEEEQQQTWQQFFLNNSLSAWQQYALLEILAEEEGFQPDEATQLEIDNMVANAEANAIAYGYTSVEEWLQAELGVAVSVEDYVRFNTSYFMGTAYLETFYTDKYPTTEEIEAYYAENEVPLNESGISKDLGLNSSVRHILIAPEGGTTDESGVTTYSDEEWAAAEAEAQGILTEWKAGAATQESFTELATANSDDPGVTTNSGLYEDININASYLEEFKNWAIEETRKPGDTEIVKTSAGYHIMYFVEGEEYWLQLAGEQLVADRVQQMLLAAMEEHPMKVNYRKIVLINMELGA